MCEIEGPHARPHDRERARRRRRTVGGGREDDRTTTREHDEEDEPVGGGGGESTTAREEPREREHGEEDDPGERSADKPSLLPLIATITTHNFSYGPSLAKGAAAKPPTLPRHSEITEDESRGESEDERVIDRESFARAFDVAALRVPAEDCFDQERRLRGHLLNWPRVRNVARVAGDEMEEELKRIVRGEGEEGEGEEKFDALNRRIQERERG
ncbi:hypothetical protein Syun_030497 [Stephania yunnanensis]|uniref:Uncharacterized protein n=1 Tax=Stephania yunnanensis TaxID=152371 RepID=A0AAP0EF34_9MAGN